MFAAAAAIAVPAPAQAPGAAAPFERFFTGRTEGSGTVQIILSGKHGMRESSRGRMEKGALLLDQVVKEEGKPDRRRSWRLVRSGANGIAGTISDAKGPVAGSVRGNLLHLKYRMPEGSVEQWVTLQPGGRSAVNKMVFHRFGMKVATVSSTIRKVE
jgi:hypothetical protein